MGSVISNLDEDLAQNLLDHSFYDGTSKRCDGYKGC